MKERHQAHATHAANLLERLRQVNRTGDLPPSTAELQEARIYGLRPVNRVGDLRQRGFDIQMLKCPHGVNRWKLHEPPRTLGLQEWRNKKQLCLPIPATNSEPDRYLRQTGQPLLPQQTTKNVFTENRLALDDCFRLTPPEVHQ